MKQILTLAILLCTTLITHAQRFHFGIKTNLGISNITTTKIKNDNYHKDEKVHSKNMGSIGLFVEVPIFKYASVQVEGLYSGAGFRHTYHDFGEQDYTYNLTYLSFPVIVKARYVGIGLYGGIQYGSLRSAKKDPLGNSGYSYIEDVKAAHQSKEWSMVCGVEYTSPIGLGASFRYQHGLTTIAQTPNDRFTEEVYLVDKNTVYNRIFQFGIYYRFIRERKKQKQPTT